MTSSSKVVAYPLKVYLHTEGQVAGLAGKMPTSVFSVDSVAAGGRDGGGDGDAADGDGVVDVVGNDECAIVWLNWLLKCCQCSDSDFLDRDPHLTTTRNASISPQREETVRTFSHLALSLPLQQSVQLVLTAVVVASHVDFVVA